MANLEVFNNNALSKKSDDFFKLFVEDTDNINDLRFLILRFCIALEKTADEILNRFKKRNLEKITDIVEIQFQYFKLENQEEKLKFPKKGDTFAIKISFLESICKFKEINSDFINLISFFKSLRNIIAHQFISKEEFINYIIEKKTNINLNFVNNIQIKKRLVEDLNKNSFEDFFILLATSLMLINLNQIV